MAEHVRRLVCLFCGKAAPKGSFPLGTLCEGCKRPLMLRDADEGEWSEAERG